MLCSRRSTARHEVRIFESRFAVSQFSAIERRDPSTRRDHDSVTSSRIPFHGAAKPRIEIGDAFRDEAATLIELPR